MSKVVVEPSSFRDPSGFVFYKDGKVYRQVNEVYKDDYDNLIESNLLSELEDKQLIISYKDSDVSSGEGVSYKTLEMEQIPFISYPYEWSFTQLKDAALTTLKIQRMSLNKGFSLKDASAYNIQFVGGKPKLIDLFSFEQYEEEKPWVAYKQFCQHFLAPLALMSYVDIRLSSMLRTYIDGIPLDLASKLLPKKSYLNPGILTHIHLHAGSQKRYSDKQVDLNQKKLSLGKHALLGILDNLESTVKKLSWKPKGTEWGEYYTFTNYSDEAFQHKGKLVKQMLKQVDPETVWDLGGNTGEFSRIASELGAQTVSFDIDQVAIEKNYRQVKDKREENILPLLSDLTNPSPAIGWNHQERMSLVDRGPVDTVMALALIHHLAISNNLPLEKIAEFFANITNCLIIEFVPKEDSQVQILLSTREDIFPEYNPQGFEKSFAKLFNIKKKVRVSNSKRTLYMMLKS